MFNSNRNTTAANGNASMFDGTTTIGSFRVKNIYLYTGIAIVVFIALYFVTRMLNTSLIMHFGMLSGILLIWANVRDLRSQTIAIDPIQKEQRKSLLHMLIGGALIFAWLSQILTLLLWIPAIFFIGAAVPLALGNKHHIYLLYTQSFSKAINAIRSTVGR